MHPDGWVWVHRLIVQNTLNLFFSFPRRIQDAAVTEQNIPNVMILISTKNTRICGRLFRPGLASLRSTMRCIASLRSALPERKIHSTSAYIFN